MSSYTSTSEWRRPGRMALDLNMRIGGVETESYLAAFRIVKDTGLYAKFVSALPIPFKIKSVVGRHRAPSEVSGRYDVFLCRVEADMRPIKFIHRGHICADLLTGPFDDALLPLWAHDWTTFSEIDRLPEFKYSDLQYLHDMASAHGVETFEDQWSLGQAVWRQTSAKSSFEIRPYQ